MATDEPGTPAERQLPDLRAGHSSRTYDYLLGGKDNLQADRTLMDGALELTPDARVRVRAQRLFLTRAVRYLVGEAGVRQLLDIGCGYPATPAFENVHETAQRIVPGTRVAYVDNNPVAVAHMQALQADGETTVAFHGDLREPEAILADPAARAVIDPGRPIGVLLVSVLQCLTDDADPAGVLTRLRTALPPGSYVTLTHISTDLDPGVEDVVRVWQQGATPLVQRSRAELERIVDGFELLEPGMVPIHQWRPDDVEQVEGNAYGLVARTR